MASSKNIENNPMQSKAGGRRQGRFGPIHDTSGKSAALLHHRTIRQTPAGLDLLHATIFPAAEYVSAKPPRLNGL
jgi:hypothetical protein